MVKGLEEDAAGEHGEMRTARGTGEGGLVGSGGTGEARELCRGLREQSLECQAESPKDWRKPSGP